MDGFHDPGARRHGRHYFVDEASVRSDAHLGLTWGKRGETPVIKDSGVTPQGDIRFSFIEGKMNSRRFIELLKQLRGDAGKPVIVIVDNARYHHSKEMENATVETAHREQRRPRKMR